MTLDELHSSIGNNGLDFERCALCAGSSELQASHIIPRFVFEWLRRTSATGRIRSSETPNRRVQDGMKPRMLCWNCEQLFSSWEKEFAENCFSPLNSGSVRHISYGPWMLKFATSISWRVLRTFASSGNLDEFPEHVKVNVNGALRRWSQFLLGHEPNPGPYEQHMLVSDVVVGTTFSNVPHNISRYLARAIEVYVTHDGGSAMSYAKLGRFVLFGFIGMKYPRRWKGTKLHIRHGKFGQHDVELPMEVGDFIFKRARLAAGGNLRISERQLQRIRESYVEDPTRAAQSETLRAMQADVSMFGKSAFKATQRGSGYSEKSGEWNAEEIH